MKISMLAALISLGLALSPHVALAQTDQNQATTPPGATATMNPENGVTANPNGEATTNPYGAATTNPLATETAAPGVNTYTPAGGGGSPGWWGLVGLLGLLGLFGGRRTTISGPP